MGLETWKRVQLDFGASPALSAEAIQQVEDQADALELEELISQLESGKHEDGSPMNELEMTEIENRVLLLDSMIRRKRKAIDARTS